MQTSPSFIVNLAGAYFGLGQICREATSACYQARLGTAAGLCRSSLGLGPCPTCSGPDERGSRLLHRRALQEKPDLVAALANLGDVLADQGQLAEATGYHGFSVSESSLGQAQGVHYQPGQCPTSPGSTGDCGRLLTSWPLQAKPDLCRGDAAQPGPGMRKNLVAWMIATAWLQRAARASSRILPAAHNTLGLLCAKPGTAGPRHYSLFPAGSRSWSPASRSGS